MGAQNMRIYFRGGTDEWTYHVAIGIVVMNGLFYLFFGKGFKSP